MFTFTAKGRHEFGSVKGFWWWHLVIFSTLKTGTLTPLHLTPSKCQRKRLSSGSFAYLITIFLWRDLKIVAFLPYSLWQSRCSLLCSWPKGQASTHAESLNCFNYKTPTPTEKGRNVLRTIRFLLRINSLRGSGGTSKAGKERKRKSGKFLVTKFHFCLQRWGNRQSSMMAATWMGHLSYSTACFSSFFYINFWMIWK